MADASLISYPPFPYMSYKLAVSLTKEKIPLSIMYIRRGIFVVVLCHIDCTFLIYLLSVESQSRINLKELKGSENS